MLAIGAASLAGRGGPEGRSDRFGDPLPTGALARIGTVRLRHDGAWVSKVCWLPDGKHLVSYGDDGQVRFWDATTGRRLGALRYPAGVVELAPDAKGKLLGLIGKDNRVCLYKLSAGLTGAELLRSFRITRPVSRGAFSADLGRVAVWGSTRTVGVWDTRSGKELFALSAHLGAIHSAVFGPNGRWIATGGADARIRLWDGATGRPGPMLAVSGDFGRLAFTPDGQHVVAGGRRLRIWHVAGLKEPRALPVSAQDVLGIWPEGRRIVVACKGPGGRSLVLKVVDAGTGKVLGGTKGIPGWTKSLALSPDGKRVATAGRRIRIWDLASGREVHPQPPPDCRLGAIAFRRAGSMVIVADLTGHITLWRAATGELIGHHRLPWRTVRPAGLGVSPDGKLLAVNLGSLVWLGQLRTGREVRRFRLEPAGRIAQLAFSPEGRLLAVAGACAGRRGEPGEGWLVQLRAVGGGEPVWTVRTGERAVGAMRFSPDGRRLAVAEGGELGVYDARTGRELVRVKGLEPGGGLAFRPDGRAIAWAGPGGVSLVELRSARRTWFTACFDKADPKARRCFAIAFGPQAGRIVATDGVSGMVVLDGRKGSLVRRFRPAGPWAALTAISENGRMLAWARPNGTILIWAVEEIPGQKGPG